jgi:cation:H+ antiporter
MTNTITLIMPYIFLVAGLGVLIISGNILVTGSVQLARHLKMSTLLIGLTVVAFGTSAPELFTSISAALDGAPDIALGNVIGSNIANIALVLGLVALVCPIFIRNKLIGFDYMVMLFVSVFLLLIGFNGSIGRVGGFCLVFILVSYIISSVIKSRDEAKALEETGGTVETEKATIKPLTAILMVAAAIAGLYFSSGWFVRGARDIALHWGVSERVIGISIVAVGTSIPELTASLIAAFRKEPDLSVGNIIGSNLFNIAGVLGLTAIISPLRVENRSMFVFDMIWVLGLSVVFLLIMLPLSNGKISRWKGGLLLALYFAYMVILFR